jgi:esterase/lipase
MITQKENFRVRRSLVDSDKVVFVFTAMATHIEQYAWFIKQLNKKGYSVIAYDYPQELVLEARMKEFGQMYTAGLKPDAVDRIKRLKPRQIYAFGVSMGTVLAARLAWETPEIHHVIMCLTYGDIADNIMHSPATEQTRINMKNKGLTVDDLRATTKAFDPVINAPKLADKKVWLHLSRRDEILDYSITVNTKKAFQVHVRNFKYTQSRVLKHYGAAYKQLFNVGAIDRFFKS